jgi:serine/threonine-protein kinase RsbW
MDAMTSVPASIPYVSAAERGRWTLYGFGELRLLRAALRQAVAGNRPYRPESAGPGDLAEPIIVVANELATNALRHGSPPTVVRLLTEPGRLILDVVDHSPEALPRPARDRPPGAGGLGLRLTATFAIDFGWYATGATKHVWAAFPS